MECFIYGDIHRTDFTTTFSNSDGKPIESAPKQDVVLLHNANTISQEEVDGLIHSGMYEFDPRVIAVSPAQAENLTKKNANPTAGDMIRNMSDKTLSRLMFSLGTAYGNTLEEKIRYAIKDQQDHPNSLCGFEEMILADLEKTMSE